MNTEALLAAACAETGLDDFGGDSFREGLEALAASLDREAGLHEVGHVAITSQIVAALANRFRVTTWIGAHPEVLDERVERPLVVLGLPRTGTSCDSTPAYECHRCVLQLLQSRAPGRWALKTPAHSLALPALAATYPDARLVMTHRDPVKVVASTCSLVAYRERHHIPHEPVE